MSYDYTSSIPYEIVPRLSVRDFSSCGGLTAPKFKTMTTIVLFYNSGCRFCYDFSKELTKYNKQYASSNNSMALAVDLTSENSPLIKSSGNFPYKLGESWPTIIVFYKGYPCANYTSVRTAEALNNFITEKIGANKTCSFKYVPCD